jgi:hypothetical protein
MLFPSHLDVPVNAYNFYGINITIQQNMIIRILKKRSPISSDNREKTQYQSFLLCRNLSDFLVISEDGLPGLVKLKPL